MDEDLEDAGGARPDGLRSPSAGSTNSYLSGEDAMASPSKADPVVWRDSECHIALVYMTHSLPGLWGCWQNLHTYIAVGVSAGGG